MGVGASSGELGARSCLCTWQGFAPGPCSALLLGASALLLGASCPGLLSWPPVLGPTALPHVPDNPVWIKAPQLLDSRATNWGEPQDSRKCSPPDLTPVPKGAHTILRGVANRLATIQDPFPLYPVVFTFFVSWLQHLKIKKLHVKKYRYLAFQKIQPGWIGVPAGTEKQLPLGGRTLCQSPPPPPRVPHLTCL